MEKAGRGLIAIEHHGVATLRFAGTRVEQGLAVAHITVGQALPTLLAIVPFANILAADVKLVVHGRTHLVDVASRGRTILVAIAQASAGAGGVHQHRHGGVLLERSGAAKLHEVVTHRGAGGQREGNGSVEPIAAIGGRGVEQGVGVVLTIIVNDLRSSRCHTSRQRLLAVVGALGGEHVVGIILVPLGLHKRMHVDPRILIGGQLQALAHGALRHLARACFLLLLQVANLLGPSVEHVLQTIGHVVGGIVALVGITEDGHHLIVATGNDEALAGSAREDVIRCVGHVVGRGVVDGHKRLRHLASLLAADGIGLDLQN